MALSRRDVVGMAVSGAALAAGTKVHAQDAPARALSSLTQSAQPITAQEHSARIAKVQSLMQQRKVAALLVEAGSSLEYFTGIRWWRSERTTAVLIPAAGGVSVVTPYFEEASIRETLKVAGDVMPWKEDESPFELIAGVMRDHAPKEGPLAVESTTRFFIIDAVTRASRSGRQVISGDDLVRPCRMIKSTAELALLQAANDVTIAALKHVHGKVEAGMQRPDIMRMLVEATELWVVPAVPVLEGTTPLDKPVVTAARVSLPSDRSFESYDLALAHFSEPLLPASTSMPTTSALLDVLLDYKISSDRSRFSSARWLPRWRPASALSPRASCSECRATF